MQFHGDGISLFWTGTHLVYLRMYMTLDFFMGFERARRDEHSGISHLRICCQIKTLEGDGNGIRPLYVRVTKIEVYVRVLTLMVSYTF